VRAPSTLLFVFLLLPYAYFNDGSGWNQRSRLAELHSVVLKRTLSIDHYHEVTGDKALIDGHYYSEKAPATALLALPVFAATVMVQQALHIDPDREAGWDFSQWLSTVGSVGTIAALGGVAFFSLVRRSMSAHHALLGTLAVFLGSLTWPYATALFAHAATIGLLSIAMWCVLDVGGGHQAGWGKPSGLPSEPRDVLGGFCAGLAVACEYPAVFGCAGLALIVARAGRGRALRFCRATLPAVALILLKNYLVTGSPWTVSYGSKPEFPGETAANNFGYGFPTLNSLSGLLFSEYRGLFYWSPVLLMAVPGLVAIGRKSAVLAATIVVVFLLQLIQMSSFYNWFGGNAIGARYLSPAVPFLGLAAAHGINRLPKTGAALTALSVGLMAMVTAIDIAPLQDAMRPFRDFYLPRLLDADFAQNLGTVLGLPPMTSLDVLAVIMLLVGWRLLRALEISASSAG
jgi:hypothetical protein